MADEISNGTNLVPPRSDRRTLAKMRSKLASSGQRGKRPEMTHFVGPKRQIRIWPFVIGLALALAGMEFAMYTRQDSGTDASAGRSNSSARLAPPPGLSLDEQARFWCYAVYDYPKLKSRFKPPRGSVFDMKEARANLERVLAEDLGNSVRNEIFVYQQAHPDRSVVKSSSKPSTKKK
ncbi:MAG: hypothetical protein JF616_09705 [Fibrobacteres bacterium]|jgi:hypothetical protein|nr:hypothetical protein [Fibrobacterota bacterium]